MRLLLVHNRYQQKGGEDTVVAAEAELLSSQGHVVERLEADNEHIQGALSQVQAAGRSIYSLRGRRHMRDAIRRFRPDVVHVHNFFPTLSPSIFDACVASGVPAVQTLHNFRLQCAASTLFRHGHVCEACVEQRSFWPGVRHACYRGSRFGSAVVGLGMSVHEQLGTWSTKIAAYIALTDFAASKLGQFRIPADKIVVKPNFVRDHGVGEGGGGYALFVGRLSPEKGLQTLIEVDAAGTLTMDVLVVGHGPERPALESAAAKPGSRLIVKGPAASDQILDLMKAARVLVIPSVWYEGQPMVFLEALSVGLPVIAANFGSFAGELEARGAGLTYRPGSAEGLAEALEVFTQQVDEAAMRRAARAYYLAEYTPEQNYQRLRAIYEGVSRNHKQT